MFIRGITAVVACVATIAFTSDAAAQDTTRTRDTMHTMHSMQQHRAMTMTVQGRDSLIARLLDSAGRAQDPTIARRLRDSVTVLRSAAVSGDNMSNRMSTMQQQQRDSMQQRQGSMQQMQRDSMQRRQADRMQQRQPSSVTSDQRVRMQKDGRPYQDGASSTTPPDESAAR